MGVALRRVERSDSNKFMYYTFNKAMKMQQKKAGYSTPQSLRRREIHNELNGWKPPQAEVFMRFQDFLVEAQRMENINVSLSRNSSSPVKSVPYFQSHHQGSRALYYLTMSSIEAEQVRVIFYQSSYLLMPHYFLLMY